MQDNQTMKGCDERYIPVVRAIESTNMWIKIVSSIGVIAFWIIVTITNWIFSSIKNIEEALNDHKLGTMQVITQLTTDITNLKDIAKNNKSNGK